MHGSDSMKMRRVHAKRLEERALIEINLGDPSKPLIELPVDLPTIPIIGSLLAPLVTPLIGGPGHTTTTTAAVTTTPATIATQSPTQVVTPTPTSTGGNTSGGDSGNSNGGSTSGGEGSSGGNSNGGNGSSNGNSPTTGNPTTGAGNSSPSSPSNPSVSGSGLPSHTPSSNQSGASNTPSGSNPTGTSSTRVTASPLVQNVQAMNVQDDPNVSGASSAAHSSLSAAGSQSSITRSAASSQSTSSTGSTSGSGGSDGGGDGGQSTLSDDSGTHGLSKGAIAAIAVVASLVGIVFFFFIARKCYRSKRTARRQRWFQSGNYYSAEPVSSDQYFSQNRISHRSSFGTTYDQGQRPISPSDLPFDGSWSSPAVPPVPDMTLKDASSPSVSITMPSQAHPSDHPPSPVVRTSLTDSEAASLHSALESQSRSQSQMSQYVTVPDSATLKPGSGLIPEMAFPSPISVRPFSPTESWSFPKPPNDDMKRRSDAILSARQSQSTLRPPPSHNDSMDTLSNLSNADYYTAESQSINPFADFTSVDSHMTTIHTDPSNADHFSPVEIIRRPFVPTMSDEMAVAPGDQVRIRRRFDDGWAYAEKLSGEARGLFPIDCLRSQDQDLSSFLAAKRLSSYAGAQDVGQAI